MHQPSCLQQTAPTGSWSSTHNCNTLDLTCTQHRHCTPHLSQFCVAAAISHVASYADWLHKTQTAMHMRTCTSALQNWQTASKPHIITEHGRSSPDDAAVHWHLLLLVLLLPATAMLLCHAPQLPFRGTRWLEATRCSNLGVHLFCGNTRPGALDVHQ
jgi:hypothetical protein